MAKTVLFSSLSLLSALAAAQPTQQVTITGRIQAATLGVGGFGSVPLERSPFAASLLDASQLQEAGARSIADLTRLDAAISDAYNAEGYWQSLTVRGFTLDNRFNYRRDGLPVNAETAIPLANKAAVEVFKGTSGIQAGTSSPGGLVNYVVKRPTENLRSATVEWREHGSWTAATDISQRFGADDAFGVRLNATYEHLDPQVRNAKGQRHAVALAGDWRIAKGTVVEAEFETSHQSQPSVPGFSMLGNVLPDARTVDPRLNLNNQPWSLPVVFDANTASIRVRQQLGEDWRVQLHAMTQQLRTDDRVAFPFGCSAEDNYHGYCSDGSVDFYDYRSEDEHRRSDAADLSLSGRQQLAGMTHDLSAGVLFTRFDMHSLGQAYNSVGTGKVDGSVVLPADPTLAYPNTNRKERSTEWYLRDAVQLHERWSLWAGLRHTQLTRNRIGTDGSEPLGYDNSFTSPWLALAHQLAPRTMVYASWGRGIESDAAPKLPTYRNAGQAVTQKSRQVELGIKHGSGSFDAGAAVFDIERPAAADLCNADATECTRSFKGSDRHRGAEALLSWREGPWHLHGSAMWLDAERRGTDDPAANGKRPTNVAERTLRLYAEHRLAVLPGSALTASLVHEGDRMATPDNSVRIPSWTRIDLAARYSQQVAGTTLSWLVGVDNVANKRAWKEAPFQYSHVYLFPMAPRTFRIFLQADI